ncbi:MAG: sugar phosphate nucleotidyltransferase [Candidatus Latescibacterota bacterium]
MESVRQDGPQGLGHAIYLTRDVVGSDPMLTVYGDTIFQADLAPVLATDADGLIGVQTVDDPRRFGVVVEDQGGITRLVEKPPEPVSRSAIVGVNYLRASGLLFDCLSSLVSTGHRTRGGPPVPPRNSTPRGPRSRAELGLIDFLHPRLYCRGWWYVRPIGSRWRFAR